MTTTGPNYPTNSSSVAAGGDFPWSNPSNANADDDVLATDDVDGVETGETELLQCLGFGFSIPGGATIDGITVEIQRKSSGTQTTDLSVRLYKGGTLTGNDKATATVYTTSLVTASYGGAADLWGTTWTDSDINAANFGVGFRAAYGGTGNRTVSVDFIRVTIDYTAGGGGTGTNISTPWFSGNVTHLATNKIATLVI